MTSARPQPKHGILSIAPYVGGKSAARGGGRAIKLSSNETPLGPSPAAIEAYRAAEKSLHRYPDGNATKLREAIAEMHNLPMEQIVCGAGSDELIGLLVHAYAGEGDEVLYSAHGFLMYKIYAQGAGATPVAAREKNLRADVDALLAAVTPRTRMLFLANPNNPTGSYLPAQEVYRLREKLRADILLVLDEAYAEYVTAPDYADGKALVATTGNTVLLRTFSKIHGLPALRLGWGYMPAPVADVLNRLRGPFNVSAPAIAAGSAAIRDTAWVKKSIAFNTAQRGWLRDRLDKLGLTIYPSEGNFLLVDFPAQGPHTAQAANEYLLERGIIVREVGNYGLPHALRVTVGLEEENRALMDALQHFMQQA